MRRKSVRYRMNNKSFNDFIMSPQMLDPTMEVAEDMMREMEAVAPRSHDGEGTPYAESFGVAVKPEGIVAGKYRNRRVAVSVYNTAPHAPVIEFGGKNEQRPSRRIMLRTGAKYGDVGGMA